MARNVTKHQRRQERLAEDLVYDATGIERDDVNFPTALQYVVSNLRYHRYLDASRPDVERTVEGLCTKFAVHAQREKGERLRQLAREFMQRDLKRHSENSECHIAVLSFILHLSESPLTAQYEEEEWRLPDIPSGELSAAEWHKILHSDNDFGMAYSSGSDLEPWSSGDDDDDAKTVRPTPVVSTVGQSTRAEPTDDVSATAAAAAAAGMSQTMHQQQLQRHQQQQHDLLLHQKAFLHEHLTDRYWQRTAHVWPATHLRPGRWQGKDDSLAALCATARQERNVLRGPAPHYEVSEAQVVRETIWALCGSTQLFVYTVNGCRGAVQPTEHVQVAHFSESSLRSAMASFARLATCLACVRRFVTATLEAGAGLGVAGATAVHSCQTYQAFASALNAMLSGLTAKLCELENLNRESDSCRTILQLRIQLAPIESKIQILHRMVTDGVCVETDKRKAACHLIHSLESILSDLSLVGQNRREERDTVMSVFLTTLRPYMAAIERWMTYGHLIDPYEEYGIVRNRDFTSDPDLEFSPEWWRNAFTLWSPVLRVDGAGTDVGRGRDADSELVDAVPEMLKASLPQGLKAGKSLCLLKTLEKMSTGDAHVLSRGACHFKASLFQDFLHCLQCRLLGLDPKDTGSSISDSRASDINAAAGDDEGRQSLADTASLATRSSLSISSVGNFDIDDEFRQSHVDGAGYESSSEPTASVCSTDSRTTTATIATASSWASDSANHRLAGASSTDGRHSSPPRSSPENPGRLCGDGQPAAMEAVDGPPASAPALSYLSAVMPNALLRRNFCSLAGNRQGAHQLQKQLAVLKTSRPLSLHSVPMQRTTHGIRDISTSSLPPLPDLQKLDPVSARIGSSHNSLLQQQQTPASGSCPAGASPTSHDDVIHGSGDVIPEQQVARHAVATHGVSTVQPRSALRVFSDDLDAVARLVNTLPLNHVPLSMALRHSLPALLHRRSDAVCLQLADVLRDQYQLKQHMKNLQGYFLMEAGSVMHHFAVAIFEKIRRGADWLHTGTLNALLQESLSYGCDFDTVSSLLSVEVVDPSKATPSTSRRLPSAKRSLSEATFGLDHLLLRYRTDWPVDIVVDNGLLDGLNGVFRFLLHLKFAKWSLDNCFWRDTVFSNRSKRSPVYKLAFLLRLKLVHVVNAVHTYIMTRILHSVGQEFTKNLEQAEDVDTLIECFRSFVQLILDRCLLNKEASIVREAVLKLLRQAVLFRQVCDSGLENASFEKMSAMMEECDKCHTFLLSIFNGIIRRGVFPHLEALALSLVWR